MLPSHESILKNINKDRSKYGVSLDSSISTGTLPSNDSILKRINTSPTNYGLDKPLALGIGDVSPEKEEDTRGFFERVKDRVLKFGASTAVEAGSLFASTADVAGNVVADFIAGQFSNPLYAGKKLGDQEIGFDKEAGKRRAEKWLEFYDKGIGSKTKKVRVAMEGLRSSEYLQPSEEWQSMSLTDKLTKRPLETVLEVGPGVVASIGTFAVSVPVGFAVSAGSVASEIRDLGLEAGLENDKANRLALGTGLLVGLVDKAVPDELFSGQQKGQFAKGLMKRVVKTGLKESGTEMLQEDMQILVESTLREDLSMDEVVERNVMAGLGGLLGGSGAQSMVTFVNQMRAGNIGDITAEDRANLKIEDADAPSPFDFAQEEKADIAKKTVSRETILKKDIPNLPTGVDQASISIRPDGTASFNIEVSEEQRGSGVGSKAVEAMESVILSKDVKDVVIPVKKESEGFFEKLGYKKTQELDNGLVEMVKTLEQEQRDPDLIAEGDLKTKEQELVRVYSENKEAVNNALYEVFAEFEVAEAGQRIFTENGEVIGIKSSFPDWVPEHLRSKDLFDKVLGNITSIEDLKYPEGNRTRQRELYDEILDTVDKRSGVDTSALRSDILSLYEKGQDIKSKKSTSTKEKADTGIARGVQPEKVEDYTITDSEYSSDKDIVKAVNKYDTAEEFARVEGHVMVSPFSNRIEIMKLFPKKSVRGKGLVTKQVLYEINEIHKRNGYKKVYSDGFSEEGDAFNRGLVEKGYLENAEYGRNRNGEKTFTATITEKLLGEAPTESPLEKVYRAIKKTENKPSKKPSKSQKIETVKVPRSQLPVGEGKLKASRLEARMKGVLDKVGQMSAQELDEAGLSTYMTAADDYQLKTAAEFVENNEDEALRVVSGISEAPRGLLKNSVYLALKAKGADNAELAQKIASLASTRFGQEISILRNADPDNPVTVMEKVVKIREAQFEKRTRKTVEQKVKEEVSKINKEAKAPSARQWDSFLESIRC